LGFSLFFAFYFSVTLIVHIITSSSFFLYGSLAEIIGVDVKTSFGDFEVLEPLLSKFEVLEPAFEMQNYCLGLLSDAQDGKNQIQSSIDNFVVSDLAKNVFRELGRSVREQCCKVGRS